jgi:hypothetical protein
MTTKRKFRISAGVFGVLGLLAAVTLTVRCGTSGNGADASTGSQPLSVCAQGWLIDTTHSNCDGACLAKTPECGHTDCYEATVNGFLANGVAIDFMMSYSASAGTMSTISDYTKRTYTIGDTTINETPGNPLSASCADGQLTLGGYEIYAPASTAFTAAFNQQYASGKTLWVGVPVAVSQ